MKRLEKHIVDNRILNEIGHITYNMEDRLTENESKAYEENRYDASTRYEICQAEVSEAENGQIPVLTEIFNGGQHNNSLDTSS